MLEKRIEESKQWKKIFVENRVLQYPWIENFLQKNKDKEICIISDISEIIAGYYEHPYPADSKGFHSLLIGKQQSKFIRPCPCSPQTIRCGYFFISIGLGCPIDCSYCFLQGFLNTSFPVLYANLPDLFEELDQWEKELAQENCYVRAGTGEMTDSLVFEPEIQYGKILVEKFSQWPHIILELKTKTTFVENLFHCDIPNNVVLAWSLNPTEIACIEECHAPGLHQRLDAAQLAVQAGYRVGFHFDPIIVDNVEEGEWQRQYSSTIQEIFSKIPAQKIAWISLGTFRIFPTLRDTIRQRHPNSRTLLGEMVLGYDGKLRYFRPIRVQIYRQMVKWIESMSHGQTPIYLCMDSSEVWHDVFGSDKLPNLFKNVVIQ